MLKSFVIPLHMDTKPGSVAAVVRFSIVTLVDSCRVYALWESIVSTHCYICIFKFSSMFQVIVTVMYVFMKKPSSTWL